MGGAPLTHLLCYEFQIKLKASHNLFQADPMTHLPRFGFRVGGKNRCQIDRGVNFPHAGLTVHTQF